MRSVSFPKRPEARQTAWIAASFVLALTVRVAFTLTFPTIHGGDAAARLAHPDSLVLGYQLPLPQMFVALGRFVSDGPVLTRLIFCVWGAALVAGMTALLTLLGGTRTALFGALLFALDPLLTHYSIVPYQEGMAYGLVAWAFYLEASGRSRLGTGLMAAACLCRYEAWLFLPVFVWVSESRAVAAVAGIPILGWVAWWQGLGPAGLYVLDIDAGANRLPRFAYLGGKILEYETWLAPALALLTLLLASRDRSRALLRVSAVVTLVIAVIVLFGHEYPPGSGLMSERLIHLPVLLSLGLAAVALGRLAGTSRTAFVACLVVAFLYGARNLRFESALLRAAEREPDLALARDVARALEAELVGRDCVSVAAPSVDQALLAAYVAKVGASFGDVDRARERARALSDTSADRDRIAAQLTARPGTVRAEAGCRLLVIVDDSQKAPASATLIAELSAGPRRARVLRIPR